MLILLFRNALPFAGSWNTEDILEILLKSDESSAKTFSQVTIKQEDGVNNILLSESDIDLQKKQVDISHYITP